MTQALAEELRSAIVDYIAAHEDDLAYGKERLKEFLRSGATIQYQETVESGGWLNKKTETVTQINNRFEWGSDEGPYLGNDLLARSIDRIDGVLANGIIFLEDGFSLQGKLNEQFYICDFTDFLDLELVEELGPNVTFELDGDDEMGWGHGNISGGGDDFERIGEHIANIKQVIVDKIEQVRLRTLETRRGEIVKEVAAGEGDSVSLADSKDFDLLLREAQAKIIAIDRSYVQKFVKVSQFLKTKRENIERTYHLLREAGQLEHLEEIFSLLKDEKHVYDSVLFHSFHMITSLLDEDMITFYEIYESFDSLGIFDSQWEKETAQRLSAIEGGVGDMNNTLREILQQSARMERNLVGSINQMAYMTSTSIDALNANVSNRLAKVSSQLRLNNLMTGIQTYESVKRLR